MEAEDTPQRIARIEGEVDNLKERVSAHGEQIDKLRMSTTRTEAVLGRIDATVNKIDGKLEAMAERPGKRWESVVAAALGALVAGLVAYALALGGLA